MNKLVIEMIFDNQDEIRYDYIQDVVQAVQEENYECNENDYLYWENKNIYAYKLKHKWKVKFKENK